MWYNIISTNALVKLIPKLPVEFNPLKKKDVYRSQLVINEITGNIHGRLDRNMSDTHRTDQ